MEAFNTPTIVMFIIGTLLGIVQFLVIWTIAGFKEQWKDEREQRRKLWDDFNKCSKDCERKRHELRAETFKHYGEKY